MFIKKTYIVPILFIIIFSCKDRSNKDKWFRVAENDTSASVSDLSWHSQVKAKKQLNTIKEKQTEIANIDTFRFDPILIKIEKAGKHYIIKKTVERSDSCIFYLPKHAFKRSASYYDHRGSISKYSSFIELLNKKNIYITTVIKDTLKDSLEILDNRPPTFNTGIYFHEFIEDSLKIKFPDFNYNFMDENTFFFYKRIIVKKRMFFLFENLRNFVIACWDFGKEKPELIGVTAPFNIITIKNVEIVDEITQIDSLDYAVRGKSPELYYDDGPHHFKGHNHAWLAIFKLPNSLYFISGRPGFKLSKEFKTFYGGDIYSGLSIPLYNDSLIVLKSYYTLYDETAEKPELDEESSGDYYYLEHDIPIKKYNKLDTLYIRKIINK
jgi:hypothetical protein